MFAVVAANKIQWIHVFTLYCLCCTFVQLSEYYVFELVLSITFVI